MLVKAGVFKYFSAMMVRGLFTEEFINSLVHKFLEYLSDI